MCWYLAGMSSESGISFRSWSFVYGMCGCKMKGSRSSCLHCNIVTSPVSNNSYHQYLFVEWLKRTWACRYYVTVKSFSTIRAIPNIVIQFFNYSSKVQMLSTQSENHCEQIGYQCLYYTGWSYLQICVLRRNVVAGSPFCSLRGTSAHSTEENCIIIITYLKALVWVKVMPKPWIISLIIPYEGFLAETMIAWYQ